MSDYEDVYPTGDTRASQEQDRKRDSNKDVIRRTRIQPGNPSPKAFDYTLKLEFNFTVFDKPVNPEIALALNRILDDWSDGRYPFDVEMIYEGIQRALKQAAYQVNQKTAQEKFGGEMVVSDDGRTQTARWHVEAQKMPLDYPYLHSSPKAKIERSLSREEIAKGLSDDPETQRILSMTDEELAS